MNKSKLFAILGMMIFTLATLSAQTPVGPITKALKGDLRGLSAAAFEAEYAVFKQDFVEFFNQELARYRADEDVEERTETFRRNLYCVSENELCSPLGGIGVVGIGTFSYMNAVPLIAGVWNQDTGGIRYTEIMNVLGEERDFTTTSAPEAFLIDRKLLMLLFAGEEGRNIEKSISSEAQTAISTLRKVHDEYMQTNGSLKGFTIDMALREARLGESTLKRWKFSVDYKGSYNLPYRYIATSTSENTAGPGLKVWYDVSEARFHGYGIDNY